MLPTFPVPILSVTADAVRDLQGQDALYSLWTGELLYCNPFWPSISDFLPLSVFTKCKESVQDGRRLENISWRLWYRELIQTQVSYRPSTPELATPHPKDHRSRSSYFPAHTNEKVSPELHSERPSLKPPSVAAQFGP